MSYPGFLTLNQSWDDLQRIGWLQPGEKGPLWWAEHCNLGLGSVSLMSAWEHQQTKDSLLIHLNSPKTSTGPGIEGLGEELWGERAGQHVS